MQTLPTDCLSRLSECLETQCAHVRNLLILLTQETGALVGSDPIDLIALSRQKQDLAGCLAQGEAVRCQCVNELGLPVDLPALESALRLMKAIETADLCKNFAQLAVTCAEVNRRQGIWVEVRLRSVRRALEIVTGQPLTTEFYGPTRGVSGGVGSRSSRRSRAVV